MICQISAMYLVVGIVSIYAVVFGTVYSNTCQPFQLNQKNMNKALIGHSLTETIEQNLHECARDCMSLKICKSFDYDNIEHTCKLNDVAKSSDNSLEFVTKTGSIFSDISEWPSAMVGSCGSRPCRVDQRCYVHAGSYVCRDIDFQIPVCTSIVIRMTRLKNSQSHIQIFTVKRSKSNAVAACEEIGAKLAKVDKEWKVDAIQSILRACPALSSGEYWVDGYTERNLEDAWKFSDGSLVPMSEHFWKDDLPDAWSSTCHPCCVRMRRRSWDKIGDHRFDDQICSMLYGYICEKN